ncbi:PIR Superfamily Protein [Plasmodium ovale curtisi]|uniref:PIR Superfamily Protein n=1 Tax=Plasmodium ovale curtisi TaxID=864141 RepID=A0A1A8WG81_PLAOA|nr:PIR Superfamily Protein [Plasmodium ovale curtisi]
MSSSKSAKEQLFEKWNGKEVNLLSSFPYTNFLRGLNEKNIDIYNITCSLTEIYVDSQLAQSKNPNICVFLNEWLNNKKRIKTDNEKNIEKTKLWNNYVEELWIKLEQEKERNYWCRRNFPSSPVTTVFAACFTIFSCAYRTIKDFFRSSIKKKIVLKQNLQKYISNGLLGTSSEYSSSLTGNNRIHISYLSEKYS